MVALVICASLLLALHFYRPPASGLWAQTFFESLHVAVFGVVAISLFVAVDRRWDLSPRRHAATVFAIAVVLGLISEGAQISGPRDASFEDLISDWLGAGAGLLLMAAITHRKALTHRGRYGLAVSGVAIGLLALWPFIGVTAAYAERNLQQPILMSFDNRFGKLFRRTQHATLRLRQDQAFGRKIGNVTLGEGPWPGLILHDIWPDWSGYSTLVFEFGLQGDEPLELNLRVHDRAHIAGEQPYTDRFNLRYVLQPGRHVVRIPLDKIRDAPKGRQMDMSKIDGIVVFCSADHVGREFQLAEIRLE